MEYPSDVPVDGLTDEELRLFRERVGQGLAERPLAADPASHQRQAAELLRRVGEASHYELLRVDPGASLAEIQDAYDRTARLVHPQHASRLGLAGRAGVLEHLFERVTHAYLTLIHPGRRKDYDRQLGDRLWGEDRGARGEEARQVARRYFTRAQVLAAQEEFHQAIELLREAVRTDPRAEYYVLLGECQARNPHWLRHAVESLERAMALGDRSPAVAQSLERVRAELEAFRTGPAAEPEDDRPAPRAAGPRRPRPPRLAR